MSHFSDSLAAISGFAVTFGPLSALLQDGVVADAASFRPGGNCWVYLVHRCRFPGLDFVREEHIVGLRVAQFRR